MIIIIILNFDLSYPVGCRQTGVVDSAADCYTKDTGFESRVRHGCKTVRPFIGGNGDRLSGAPIIKWSPVLSLVVGQGFVT